MTRTASAMRDTLTHRGPDDEGVWVDEKSGIALAHRRLSIIDLSPAGRQPMVSNCGRYVIAYNGEVYNFQDLRNELEKRGHRFRGESDTEAILAAISEWGLKEALGRFNGMFAFALWDKKERRLFLARDRIGIKPLYYGWSGGVFLFGSELKALRKFPGFEHEIDRNALALFLRHNYIPAPYSIYKNIRKLEPGYFLSVDRDRTVKKTCYWSTKEVVKKALDDPFRGSYEEAEEELEKLLRDSVKLRMVSDVPLGAFLSGGIDSSTVVALMQVQSGQPVKTFTIGFKEQGYNEAVYAQKVAEHLGTDHTELYVTPKEAMAVIPRLPEIYDEPFSDSSQIPTFLISQLTRRHVTVSLSGDGGDELFGGYNRYFLAMRIWGKIGWIPSKLRTFLGNTLLRFPLTPGKNHMLDFYGRRGYIGDKLSKLGEVLSESPNFLRFYHRLVSHWKNPCEMVLGAVREHSILDEKWGQFKAKELVQKMQYLDLVTYLPDDILVKVDRASMAVSLEARVPLLDHKVVEFAWSLPLEMKVKGGEGKRILKRILSRYIPQNLIERPKMGFGVPIEYWLRGPLREWAEELLSESRLKEEGFFNPQPIRQKWREHLTGKRRWHYYLWDVLMFQAWLDWSRSTG